MSERSAAIQHHRNHLRLGWRVVVILLLITSVLAFLGVSAVRQDAAILLNPESIRELVTMVGALLVVVVALVGVYSVMVDFVFWEGWMQGLPDPRDLFPALDPNASGHRHYLVYLDGIHQSEEDHPPRVSEFLQHLEQAIDRDSLLVKGIEAYTITPVGLKSTPFGHWFWQRLFSLQEHHPNGWVRFLCSFCVQANNVIKVGISSDRRYGPVMNYELALKIARRLAAIGFHPSRASRVVLVGYSGGGEMAIGTAAMLQKLCHVPVQVITVCGVFSGNGDLETLEHVSMVVGAKDPVAALGRIAYPGRLPLLPLSNWNRWLTYGRLHRYEIASMSHNGNSGPFSRHYRDQVVAAICSELALTQAG
ncbi:alpha/beta hydrolase [Synechococcus sp. MIT S9451]|uniref:alpha/beta hydrolase n=1 Tax=Synechococcus sp. MIT S9451 TaxID=3082543 RepID=UPI0039B69DB9|tara:strand:- start:743 stop:1834 length:1092 start_codon:yes stop_codon:yes gene_type:complete